MTRSEIALAVGGGILVSALAYYLILVESAATGADNIDPLRWRTAIELALNGSPQIEDMRAMAAIYNNENGPDDVEIEGDAKLSEGPSIGPGKVLRKTAIALGLWQPTGATDEDDRSAYAAFGEDPANENVLIGWAVKVYLDKKKQAGGLIWGNNGAVRRYNGGGDGARTYAANAMTFYQSVWGTA